MQIIFKEPYESKLKKLKIKRKFVALLDGDDAVEYLNRQPTWKCFIFGAKLFTDEEREFWTKIAER